MGKMKDLAIDELNRLAEEANLSPSDYLEDEESWYVDDYLFTEEDD